MEGMRGGWYKVHLSLPNSSISSHKRNLKHLEETPRRFCEERLATMEAKTKSLRENEWIVFIGNELSDTRANDFISCPSIFMASSPLRGLKLEAFIPQVVSIGPYHSDLGPHHSAFPDNKETQRYKAVAAEEMEKHKIVAARQLSKRLGNGASVISLAHDIRKEARRVRDEYDTKLSCQEDEKLGYMLALDVSFLLEVLRSAADPSRAAGFNDYYCKRFPLPLRKSVLQDFVLLENQIPLFLLEKVLAMDKSYDEDRPRAELSFLVNRIALEVLPFSSVSEDSLSSLAKRIGDRKHLLDCLYRIVTHDGEKPGQQSTTEEKPTQFPRAVYLASCGIRFKPMEPGNMTSVWYERKRATLHVPKIKVGDDTERLFRNLIAYESHLVTDVTVLSYLRFMNSLVDTPEDVALLVEKGIIVQDIGSNEEVAKMFNNLCMNTMRVCTREYEYVARCLANHCMSHINMLKAEFKQLYFSRPWVVASVISASALLLMTLVTTYFTIQLYYKPGG